MNKNVVIILTVAVIAALGFFAFAALNAPDQRSGFDKVGDAISNLDEGVDDAARELEDRTPLERMGDNIEDATDGNVE